MRNASIVSFKPFLTVSPKQRVSLLQLYHGGLQRRRDPRVPRILRALRALLRPPRRRARGECAHQPLMRAELRLVAPKEGAPRLNVERREMGAVWHGSTTCSH